MPGSATFSWLMYDPDEPATTTIHTPTLDDTNINTVSTGMVTLGTAMDNISLGTLGRRKLTAWNAFISSTNPASEAAQREIKWEVTYRDDVTGLPGSFTVPGANTALLTSRSDLIDLTVAGWPGFVTAVEANAVSNIGNPISVVQIKLTGWSV
jgi:hypothetical protein